MVFCMRREVYLKTYSLNDLVGRSCFCLYIASGSVGRSLEILCVCVEAVHQLRKVVVSVYLHATLGGKQFLCLLETLVVRTEDDRYVPYRSFKHVMYADTEATANVCYLGT